MQQQRNDERHHVHRMYFMLNTQRLIRLTLTSLLLTAITSPSYAQSTANTAHDPTLQQNKHRLWIDRKHQQTRQWLQKTSHQIDDWFGEVDPNRPANANIRIILDTTWNEYNGVEFHPRVRGKIRLPTLEKKLSVVFGDERLDDEPQQQAVTTPYRANDNAKKLDRERERKENSSLALRWSEWNNRLPFDLDVDVGLRSYDNIFFRLKANKDWNLGHDFTLSSEQMYRYSTKHKNELHSFWQIHHQDQ
ncbi:MAG: hypothetical protein Q4D05_02910, partial [Acinetobacter sp.]|nr:hypothetical protein [Acinetobacter sp.]